MGEMIYLKLFIVSVLFVNVLSEEDPKIDSPIKYRTFLGYRDALTKMNETGKISDDFLEKLVIIKESIKEYEEANPDLVEGAPSPSSDETKDSSVTQAKPVTMNKIEPELCKLYLEVNGNYNIEGDLYRLSKRKYIHLLKYKIQIGRKNYSKLNSESGLSNGYGMDTWYHTYTDQGRNLLSLTADFDFKSLTLLTSGIEEAPIKIFENEPNCFSQLDPEDQKPKLKSFLLEHFFDNSESLHDHNLCYHKIDIKNSRGKFVNECCNVKNECQIMENLYIDIFTMFVLLVKLIFLLLCPMIIQKLFFSKNIGKYNYTVPVQKPGLKKTMLIKRVNSDYETVHRSSKFLPSNKSMQQFSNFRRLVRSIPSDEIISVNFCLLDVSVDHAELISKYDSPIQFLQYLYSTLIRCQCGRSHPFRTCYGESIVGSWSPNFLWCRLQKKCETNNSCRECLSWFAIFRFFSTIVLIIFLPLPFYAKVFYYHFYEKEVLGERMKELNNLGVEEDIYQMLVKGVYKHICYLGLFLCYFLSALVFVLLRSLFPSQISVIINQCVRDFKNINRFECFRMIMSHLILPFEKFGILGVVVGVFYWPIVIPISIVLTTIYCIPLLYIIGRVFILERPQCIDGSNFNQVSLRSHGSHSISRNVSSIANCFFLDHISPKNKIAECNVTHEKPLKKTKLLFCLSFDKTKLLSFIKNIIIGIIFITLLLSLSVMYTEAFGFAIEIVFFSILGAFLNGKEMALYLVLALIVMLYVALYLHHIKWKYSSFSHTLFEAVQSKLYNDIMNKLAKCGEVREFTAFKYFTPDELKDRTPKTYPELNNVRMRSDLERSQDQSDNIEYLSGKLHWTLNSLVIFMDENDVLRMPKDLFWRICSLNIPSSPGPIWKTLFLSTTKLLATFVYLALLLLIVLFYSDSQSEYTRWMEEQPNQQTPYLGLRVFFLLLLGLLPAVVYVLVQFCKCRREVPMIGESIAWIIKSYRRSWPVSDLVFENPESPKGRVLEPRGSAGGEACRSEEGRNEMPLKVDLLITLKDEPVYDPNRISMASNGSVQSLTSINKLSPDEATLPGGAVAALNTAQLQRPLLASCKNDNINNTTVDIELRETHKKLEYQVA